MVYQQNKLKNKLIKLLKAANTAEEEAFENTVSDEKPTTSFNEKVGFIALGSLVGVGGALLLSRGRR